MIEFDAAPREVGPCGTGGSFGMFSRNLSSLLLKASVLIPVRSLISLGRQLKSLGPAQVKLSAWIVLSWWEQLLRDLLAQVLLNLG